MLNSGVSMGDPLSPISFSIYLDWNSSSEDSVAFYFADDCTIISRGRSLPAFGGEVKKVFGEFKSFLATRDLKCEDSKSKFMLLNRKKSNGFHTF